MTLHETIMKAWYEEFYGKPLETATELRKEITSSVATAVLIAMHDYVSSNAMHKAWTAIGRVHCRTEWHAMLEKEPKQAMNTIDERDKAEEHND